MAKPTERKRDEELIARLQAEAPDVLKASVDFERVVDKVIVSSLSSLPAKSKRTKRAQKHSHQ